MSCPGHSYVLVKRSVLSHVQDHVLVFVNIFLTQKSQLFFISVFFFLLFFFSFVFFLLFCLTLQFFFSLFSFQIEINHHGQPVFRARCPLFLLLLAVDPHGWGSERVRRVSATNRSARVKISALLCSWLHLSTLLFVDDPFLLLPKHVV